MDDILDPFGTCCDHSRCPCSAYETKRDITTPATNFSTQISIASDRFTSTSTPIIVAKYTQKITTSTSSSHSEGGSASQSPNTRVHIDIGLGAAIGAALLIAGIITLVVMYGKRRHNQMKDRMMKYEPEIIEI
jgi:hypothetical protein